MDDAALVAAQRAGQWRFNETLIGAPGTHVHHGDGLLALVTPAAPRASFFNAVVYDDGPALAAALPGLDAMYTEAGVRAWTVWVHHDDPDAAAACERAGHTLAGMPALMGADLTDLDLEPRHDHVLDFEPDWFTIGRLNALAYGGPPRLASVLAGLREPSYLRVVALLDGEPHACAVGQVHERSCYLMLVATDPQARRRGLAGHCTAAVLRAARDAGAVSTTLEATALGQPVYERMGYRSVGRLQMWERRGAPARVPPRRGRR